MSPELDDDHAEAICRVLVDHGVEFVVIGGMAARRSLVVVTSVYCWTERLES